MKRTKKPKSLKDARYSFWVKRVEAMLKDKNRDFAWSKLKDIKKTIEQTGAVTDRQVRAIKNIQSGKNEIYN